MPLPHLRPLRSHYLTYLLEQLTHILNLPFDTDLPLIEWGKRLSNFARQKPLGAEKMSEQEWSDLLQRVKSGVATRDLELLAEELSNIKFQQLSALKRFDLSQAMLEAA